ncbi:hypothetical protein VKT23_013461 [Stygiomarasmius scandens]|uniref:Uncharacterized protein n=1 Tax=Marasmiellus scandens TaxID=2682957 RepID=A0ABR1J629_9AGAR
MQAETYSAAPVMAPMNSFSVTEAAPYPAVSPSYSFDGNDSVDIQGYFLEPLPVHDETAEREKLESESLNLRMQAMYEESEEAAENDSTNTNVIDAMRRLGIDVDSGMEANDFESLVLPTANIDNNMDYSPYPNKIAMLLDIMDNLPRLRLSTSHFKLILWLLNQAGVQQVPSYDAFRSMQKNLGNLCGSEPLECTSSIGNHFYVNDPRESIKQQFANPEVVSHINFYPEESNGPISEVWQAERWREFNASELTPMYSANGKQFYINEVAMLQDDRLAIPLLWVKRNGSLHADCHLVGIAKDGTWVIDTTKVESIQASEFDSNYLEIIQSVPGNTIPWNDPSSVPLMPNPQRKLVDKDEDLYVVMVPVWADDVSGNKSKQYNKHINLYMQNSNLPARLLQQEYFVNFVSTSPHASSSEQLEVIRKIVNDTQKNPIRCFNAHTKRRCGVILRVPSLPADNPQQSEEASHVGSGGNKFCRRCKVGGTRKEKETDSGYHDLFSTGIPRSAAETKETLNRQLKAAMTGVSSRVEEIQRDTGTKDQVTEYWIQILIKRARDSLAADPQRNIDDLVSELTVWLEAQPGDKMNPLLDIAGLDPTRDTPVEILHTILLGIVKYVWHMFHSKLSEDEQKLFATRLQSTDTDGLTIPPLRAAYMMQYRNGLIGKHFKALMQTIVFHVHGLVTSAEFEVVKAVGELGAMLWIPEIDNMDHYLADLEIRIGNVLDAFAAVDSNKIASKIKLHLLSHLISDCRRYGPAIHNSTEIFECFNAVFRMCSILSNHQAPSRDIAKQFASMDRLKHILSGGYWLCNNEWIQASRRVRNVLKTDVTIQRHLGWVPPQKIEYGKVNPLSAKKRTSFDWKNTNASSVHCQEIGSNIWNDNHSVIANSGDSCTKGSWVAVRNPGDENGRIEIGRLVELLSPADNIDGDPDHILTVELFILGENRHPEFDMPVLQRPSIPSPASNFITVTPNDILFLISVQHDCRLGQCKTSGSQVVRQERKNTPRYLPVIEHADDNNFIINTHALHNATLLRKLLPRILTEPKPIHPDRQTYHYQIARDYRVTQEVKRKAAGEKRKTTMEKNKQVKAAREAVKDREREAGPSNPQDDLRRTKKRRRDSIGLA